ncbi:MAG: YkgJ family cysteine cluster protein [Desulfohalobiaceae bacterium]
MNIPDFLYPGLYFACQNCGTCCTGESGTIYVSSQELEPIASFLGLKLEELIQRHLYPFQDSYSILEDEQGSCHFYSRKQGCLIYPVRPWQCKSYPFWFRNLRSKKSWMRVSYECPGIGLGRLYTLEEIVSYAQQTMHI